VLYKPPNEPPQVDVRHRCRNPRCGIKLAQSTTDRRRAFCCPGCFELYHRNRCVVCEAKLPAGPSNREICRRAECRAEMRKFPQTYRWSKNGERPPRSAHKSGLKIGTRSGRPFVQIAGPELSPTALRLATLLGPELAVRLERARGRAWVDTTEIATPSWPVILVGGSDHEHELVRKHNLKPKAVGR
jgi:hypothetical protein